MASIRQRTSGKAKASPSDSVGALQSNAAEPSDKKGQPPLSAAAKCARSPRKVYTGARQLLKKREVHKTQFKSDAERWAAVRGYVVILFCNLLSCATLFMYLRGDLTAPQELWFEAGFLVLKTIVEMAYGKFSWSLLLHHSAMVLGFLLNQTEVARYWAFVTVHMQFVHIPFAFRAAWRLTLPAFGFVERETSWRRRGLSGLFWITWMLNVGYRTCMLFTYAVTATLLYEDIRWRAAWGIIIALIIANLDRVWTNAMWPKAPKPTVFHDVWFHTGTRLMFVLGFIFSFQFYFSDLYPDLLPEWARIPMRQDPGDTRLPVPSWDNVLKHIQM